MKSKAKKKPIVQLLNVTKDYGSNKVLNEFNFSINKGEFVTLLGPSGSGKTTVLRLIAGFENPTRGEIKINDLDVKDLPAYKRPTNTIFQDYALFPHLNVVNNIKYGLKLKRIKKENIDKRKVKLLSSLQIKWKAIAKTKMLKLDKVQDSYEAILKKNKKSSRKYKKARKWLDQSDFHYSYWENYLNLKTDSFNKRFLTRKINKLEIEKEVKRMISLIGLEGNERKNINQLSGGMKQRVALARSLVNEPEILLLDEPFSALDRKVRLQMQKELKLIQKKLKITFIFVTHDQEEALKISDKVGLIRNGIVEQYDTPREIYDYPKNKWVAQFIGNSNIFKGEIKKDGYIHFLNKVFKGDTLNQKGQVDLLMRPEDFEIRAKKGKLKGIIISTLYKGSMYEHIVKVDKVKITVESTKKYEINKVVYLDWEDEYLHVMEKE